MWWGRGAGREEGVNEPKRGIHNRMVERNGGNRGEMIQYEGANFERRIAIMNHNAFTGIPIQYP